MTPNPLLKGIALILTGLVISLPANASTDSDIANKISVKSVNSEQHQRLINDYEKLLKLLSVFKDLVMVNTEICSAEQSMFEAYIDTHKELAKSSKTFDETFSTADAYTLVEIATSINALCKVADLNVEALKDHFENALKPKVNLFCGLYLERIKDNSLRRYIKEHYCKKLNGTLQEIEKMFSEAEED